MPITNFSLFFSITFIASASPGPVMLSCMANGGRLGMSKAFVGMLGASIGHLCLVVLSAIGLGFILSQNNLWFNIVKWGGAGYLVLLGLQIIRTPVDHEQINPTAKISSAASVYWNSFLIAVSNPKNLIYFGALFPQFISYHEPLFLQFLVLTITFLITDFIWMFAYAVAGNKIMHWLKTPKHQILFNTLSGLALIIAGLFMALSGKS